MESSLRYQEWTKKIQPELKQRSLSCTGINLFVNICCDSCIYVGKKTVENKLII